ncbi:hypothetical protein DXC26_12695 [Clostridiaceae bacterium OM08-6BH]|nr:hypothetical protein DXC26_12695 [Clostridiaceae bacterium OM08-6BH]
MNQDLFLCIYDNNQKKEELFKELREYGQLLDKPLIDSDHGLDFNDYLQISQGTKHLASVLYVAESTINRNFRILQENIYQCYPFIHFDDINLRSIPSGLCITLDNRILYTVINRFYYYFLFNPLKPLEEITFSKDIKINNLFYPIYISFIQYYKDSGKDWNKCKENMRTSIKQLLPVLKIKLPLQSYYYWLDLFLPDELFSYLKYAEEKQQSPKWNSDQKGNLKFFEELIINRVFFSLTIQKEFYAEIISLIKEYLELPPYSSNIEMLLLSRERADKLQNIKRLIKDYQDRDFYIYHHFLEDKTKKTEKAEKIKTPDFS